MRVLLVNTLLPPEGHGGAERSVAELARDLNTSGVDVDIATLTSGDLTTGSSGPDIEVHRWRPPGAWPFSSQGRSLQTKIRWHVGETYRRTARSFLRSVLRDVQPDVVHTNNIAGFGVSILRDINRYPWVHTLRDYYLLCPRTTLFRNGMRCEKRCIDCVALTAVRRLPRSGPSQIVAVSGRVAEIHQKAGLWPGAVYSVVPNVPQQINIARRYVERIGTVGFLGRLNEAKGLGLLIRLFSRPEMRSIKLVVAGPRDISVRADVEALVRLPNVTDLGIVDADVFFSKIDLLLVPSQWEEPFGRVQAEATSIAVPALVSGRGGLGSGNSSDDRVETVSEPTSVESWLTAIARVQVRWQRYWVGGGDSDSAPPASRYVPIYERALAAPSTGADGVPLVR